MPNVQKFEHSMIEKFLKARSLKFLRDSDGDFRVEFAYDAETGCQITVWLCAEGSQKTIYSIRVVSDKRINKSDWGRAVMLCNTWNKERRWPKSYLYVKDPSSDAVGVIHLEEQIDCQKGIHQELLDDYTDTAIAAAFQFWQWAHKEQGM